MSIAAHAAPIIANGGFEDTVDGEVAHWKIGDGHSAVVTEEPAAGNRSLRIVDSGPGFGSDIQSNVFSVRGEAFCLVRASLLLESGEASGLGLYLRFWDEKGRDLAAARERQIGKPIMTQGKWIQATALYQIPAEAARAALWLHSFGAASVTCRVDEVSAEFLTPPVVDTGDRWLGGEDVAAPDREGLAVRWVPADNPALSRRHIPTADWERFGCMTFSMHSPAAGTSAELTVIVFSDNPKTTGMDSFFHKIPIDWKGWKRFVLPLRELSSIGTPAGWERVDGVLLSATGIENLVDGEAAFLVDGFGLTEDRRFGPLLSDAEFFAALDLSWSGLTAVRRAVEAGDLARAKAAYAEYIRNRSWPKWQIDWRDHPFLGVDVPAPEDDHDPDSWDYYSHFITVDWQGWKKFTLKKDDFRGRTFVEGEGWTGKNPIGWHWIKFIEFNAKGWGMTPDPNTALNLDDMRLVRPGKDDIVLDDFESKRRLPAALQRDTTIAREGQSSGRWSDMPRRSRVRFRDIPHDWSDVEALEFWAYSPEATGAHVILLLDSDPPKRAGRAADFLHDTFSYSFGGTGKTWTIQFEGPIDWHANPTEGAARTHLWNEALHRHFHLDGLSQAYWDSGDEAYATALVEDWMDWIRRNPPPLLSSGNGTIMTDCSFQTLTTGIRLERIWPNALYRCLGSPSMRDEVIVTIAKSVADQARHLMRWTTGGNWLTQESMGLYLAGMLFPEYREAADWRATAIDRLSAQLDEEVYPDGMEVELAAGYNNLVIDNLTSLVDYADMNGLRSELPDDFLGRLEKMYEYHLLAMMPSGQIPGLNDSGNTQVRSHLLKASRLFPQRQDFLFGATAGAKGTPPEITSWAFPYSGHYVMRSSWDDDAVYALIDAGPFGYAHQHEDKLHLVIQAYGRLLLLDPGNYAYDKSPWRRYVLGTHGHNTIMIDGQGQSRRGRRDTYVWPKPWDTPVPPGNNTAWITSEQTDVVRGSYREGYGRRGAIDVVHHRIVVFVKPAYFVVADTLVPEDDAPHEITALFHLDAEEAVLNEHTLAVRTKWDQQANLTVWPGRRDDLDARIAKGEADPVQGWANQPWREIPTAVYNTRGTGTQHLAFVLFPTPAGEDCPIRQVTLTEEDALLHIHIAFADGRTDSVRLPKGDTSGQASVIRRDAKGQGTSQWSGVLQ